MVRERLECELILSGHICSDKEAANNAKKTFERDLYFFALLFWNPRQLEFNIPHTFYLQLVQNTPTKSDSLNQEEI